jgi:TatD DNase family protein
MEIHDKVEQGYKMLIDAHAHIDRYDLLGEEALRSALHEIDHHKIFTLSNSMDLPSYERNLEIAERSEWILPLFGIHPWNAPEYASRLEDLEGPIARSPILGEIGLDFHFVEDRSAYPMQKRVFEHFLTAAQEQGKIVCLHTKGAESAVLEMLGDHELPGVLVHWYSGPQDTFKAFIERDFFFTFGPELLTSEYIRYLAGQAPLDRLLTETDNPGGPKSLIGHPGMPHLIIDVADKLAELRGLDRDEMIRIVQSNLQKLARRDPRLSNTVLPLQEVG